MAPQSAWCVSHRHPRHAGRLATRQHVVLHSLGNPTTCWRNSSSARYSAAHERYVHRLHVLPLNTADQQINKPSPVTHYIAQAVAMTICHKQPHSSAPMTPLASATSHASSSNQCAATKAQVAQEARMLGRGSNNQEKPRPACTSKQHNNSHHRKAAHGHSSSRITPAQHGSRPCTIRTPTPQPSTAMHQQQSARAEHIAMPIAHSNANQ
jgi:hypothetical protein